MMPPEYPVALGVIRSVAAETFNDAMMASIEQEKANSNIHSVDELLNSGPTWEIV